MHVFIIHFSGCDLIPLAKRGLYEKMLEDPTTLSSHNLYSDKEDTEILKSKLYGLPSNIEYVGEWDKIYSTFLAEILQPFLYENFNYRRMDNVFSSYNIGPTKFKTQHSKALLENEQFENLIDTHFYQTKSQLIFHTNLKNEFVEIKELIEAELISEK